ncbi:type I methionyl aminopeptidase [Candidatus Kaiserbacteria bacterium]|nr:MAG: type I methionyl aminopeptidase [Candidatus Kaiserbacteria bacterium]
MIIRTETDRDNLREGGRRLATILRKASEKAVAGVSLKDIDSYILSLIEEYGDTPSFTGYGEPPFSGVFCLSVNDGIVHGIANEYELIEGDLLKIDGGIWHEGLCTDSAITIGIGTIAKEDQELIWATKEALNAQIRVAVAGNTIGDIGHAAEEIAKKHGYGFPKELGGHGVGLQVHEPPFIANYGKKGTGEVLKAGDVLALEPMFARGSGKIRLANDGWLYEMVDGSQSAHFEHSIIVGEIEAEVLTVENE